MVDWFAAKARSLPVRNHGRISRGRRQCFRTTTRSPCIGGGSTLRCSGSRRPLPSIDRMVPPAGSALGRVADWYIDQAFQLFPVIEIDAGREIDVVLTGTFEMNLPLEDS